ncbi:MAG TPA: hypothetical protein VFE36_01970 [Candidatus Baltobacteraceae bacterium]|jgi:hypothetical protein|nr:hypothetical protein [Candidatus Baltobacteraceae bacterium]
MQVELGERPVERLADMLRETERAHGLYEQRTGHRDENWAAWYARHIIDRLTEDESSRSE